MRCGVQEALSLSQSLSHEQVLIPVEVPDRLLEITNASMDEFCGLAACAAAEIVSFYHGYFQASCGRI